MRILEYISYCLLVVALISCTAIGADQANAESVVPSVTTKEDVITSIKATMQAQEEAWNQGDLDAFMDGYWESDSLMFIGSRGLNYGWQTTLDNYKKSYPNPEAMGKLKFTNLYMDLVDENSALVIGQWQLFRTQDTLQGHYSLTWTMKNGEWVIIADHSS
ncbi:MAG: nuclear transport factor 2 family protein [Flavobacteriales bacterium]|nr:nuclear transport factor 2 family protein [Flavobacteriales bacterium]